MTEFQSSNTPPDDAFVGRRAIVVGAVRDYTLKGISKDDVLFAVEAYDALGRTSVMVYPVPGRPGID